MADNSFDSFFDTDLFSDSESSSEREEEDNENEQEENQHDDLTSEPPSIPIEETPFKVAANELILPSSDIAEERLLNKVITFKMRKGPDTTYDVIWPGVPVPKGTVLTELQPQHIGFIVKQVERDAAVSGSDQSQQQQHKETSAVFRYAGEEVKALPKRYWPKTFDYLLEKDCRLLLQASKAATTASLLPHSSTQLPYKGALQLNGTIRLSITEHTKDGSKRKRIYTIPFVPSSVWKRKMREVGKLLAQEEDKGMSATASSSSSSSSSSNSGSKTKKKVAATPKSATAETTITKTKTPKVGLKRKEETPKKSLSTPVSAATAATAWKGSVSNYESQSKIDQVTRSGGGSGSNSKVHSKSRRLEQEHITPMRSNAVKHKSTPFSSTTTTSSNSSAVFNNSDEEEDDGDSCSKSDSDSSFNDSDDDATGTKNVLQRIKLSQYGQLSEDIYHLPSSRHVDSAGEKRTLAKSPPATQLTLSTPVSTAGRSPSPKQGEPIQFDISTSSSESEPDTAQPVPESNTRSARSGAGHSKRRKMKDKQEEKEAEKRKTANGKRKRTESVSQTQSILAPAVSLTTKQRRVSTGNSVRMTTKAYTQEKAARLSTYLGQIRPAVQRFMKSHNGEFLPDPFADLDEDVNVFEIDEKDRTEAQKTQHLKLTFIAAFLTHYVPTTSSLQVVKPPAATKRKKAQKKNPLDLGVNL